MSDPLAAFADPVREWFTSTFREATAPQRKGWPAIANGDHTLILAPTGTGKTLSAFLWALNRLAVEDVPEDPKARTRVLYLSP
ncbi:MAG: DEAD/DEAH box helicase, partial [Acidimicrobiales bacterium]|nr:DEAD/DEAH box helicase [Acidimicrobiales bacterium]